LHNFQNETGPDPPTHLTKVLMSRNRMQTYEMIPD